MMMSRRRAMASLAGLALAPAIPARAQESRPWLDATLLAAARKEGPLTIYSSTNEQEGLPLFKIFEDATGIKFNYIRGNDASLMSRIAVETRAKQPSFDIVHMTNAHKMPQQLLAQFDPSEAKHVNPLARDPDRRWYGVYTVYTTPAYNTKLVSKADLPKTFEEFAQRKEWAGKVAIDHTDIEWLRGITQFYGEQKGTALVRTIAANLKPVLTDGRLAMARSVAAGEYLFALNNFVNLTLNVKLSGGAIDFFPLDPVPLYFAQVAVSSSAPNPNTARLAANFMLSRDCQVFYSKFGRLPTRSDVETNPPGIIPQIETRKVVRTQFSQEEEKRLRQTFETLLRKR
ncbi:MAG TPA: ABC transporter substrate-binding protein [Hyphomicrobiaceae bacterium]|nr:ABC transporter substrate-binding protein [Hyphomicrobiaceae bacterium]